MKRIGAGIVVGLVALAGCTPSSEPDPEPGAAQPAAESEAPAEPGAPWPLLGTETNADGDAFTLQPIVGVKVENSRGARPWEGLSQADVVFVEMVEGGLTRFHAIYNSSYPEEVGPVRSLRPMDAAILGPWGGTLIASGGQESFITRVESVLELRTMDRLDPGLSRTSGRRAPHDVVFSLAAEAPSLTDPEDVAPLAAYGIPSAEGGDTAEVVRLTYPGSASEWEWDGGAWERGDDGTPSVELDGTRIEATNVIVMDVEIRDTGAFDAAGTPVPETILTGSGDLYLFSNGQMVEGTWTKGGDADPFTLTGSDGAPLVLAPGRTWVELLPASGSLTWGNADA